MLVEFTVGNYRSFLHPVTLSMVATSLSDDPVLDRENVFRVGKYQLLRSAAVYGPNASGKSNLVQAMMFMRHFVLESATRLQAGERIQVERFRLDVGAREKPASFQIIFFWDGVRYRYGFEVDETAVRSEWLYRTVQREARLFVREGDTFDVSTRLRKEAPVAVQRQTRPNALFLSVMAQFNSPTAINLLTWFRERFRGISGLDDVAYALFTIGLCEKDTTFRRRLEEMLRLADTGIVDVQIESLPLAQANLPEDLHLHIHRELGKVAQREGGEVEEITLKRVRTTHPLFEDERRVGKESFDMAREESEGTKKFFALLGPLLDVLEHGRVLVVDELEARLHPLLTREVVRLFNSSKTNPHNAQLIFATHDAGLLGECLLRRDQVWFMQKDRYGATELYSLAEMKERKDALFLKHYLEGRYGAIPYVGNLRPFVEQELARGA